MNTINPMWKAYSDLNNEGGEGFNPHAKHIVSGGEPEWSKLGDKAARILRIMTCTSMRDSRYAELEAEHTVLTAAYKDALARDI